MEPLTLNIVCVLLSITTVSSTDNESKGLSFTQNALGETCDSQIETLKLVISNSTHNIEVLRQENSRLVTHIDRLMNQCVCKSTCTHNGTVYMDQQVWHPHSCQICQCQAGHVKCETLLMPGCVDPCSPNPCQYGGVCRQNSDYSDYTCLCPPQRAGRLCQIHMNACIQPHRRGECTQHKTMWYFNSESQKCESYIYSGCGASQNHFHTLVECQNRCSLGICCFHHLETAISERSFIIKCTEQPLTSCRKLHHKTDYEVVTFYPGMKCAQKMCFALEKAGCQVGKKFYLPNTEFTLGCEKCFCNKYGAVSCRCDHLIARKEVRDLTHEEIKIFQHAVSELYTMQNGGIWQMFVEMYSSYIMHCHVASNFLIWNRLFLRHFERYLQNIDCRARIPYYDFTTDTGNISGSFIWQPNYFGGDGENGNCVPDHPFRGKKFISWHPCLERQFNQHVHIPGMIEIATAMASTSYIQFSIAMQHVASCLHSFIGGHMSSQAAPYDPVFYSIHAYIDMLFWRWEKKQMQNGIQNLYNFDLDRIILPFNISVQTALDSENALCVTYSLPSEGKPCNYTDDHYFGPSGYNAQGFDRQGFDKDGFDRDGYNIFGYDRSGHYDDRNLYHLNGFDMEGYNRAGYDRRGYNRYGFHKSGYNRECYDVRGYNCDGFDRYGLDHKAYDLHGIDHSIARGRSEWLIYYNNSFNPANCLNFDGLTPDNFDQYGYDIYGLDRRRCSYGKNGPFVLIQANRIQEILYKQDVSFLMKLPQQCKKVSSVPVKWNQQVWSDNSTDFPGFQRSFSDDNKKAQSKSLWSQRFCLDADMFLFACPCEKESIAVCDPADISFSCKHYQNAKPVLNICHKCKLHWHVDGKIVNCSAHQDYCTPNPCLNDGVCMPSNWPTEPESVHCLCKPGYEGPFCEYEASQVCYLPLDRGTDMCGKKQERWYFNSQSGECEPFIHNGCFGNSNNFDSYYKCRVRCIIGACCWQEPLYPERNYGYDKDNYDRYGFNLEGFNRKGETQTIYNSFGGIHGIFSWDGYDYQGYDYQGFNEQGLDRHGYDRRGYHEVSRFNLTGYNVFGDYDGIIDYNEDGYDADGYNRIGFNCYGYNRDGWNHYGLCAGWSYSCRATSLLDCQQIELEFPQLKRRVIKFSPGEKCEDINCENQCGCNFLDHSYKVGEKLNLGCSLCECHQSGSVICSCSSVNTRKEIHELTKQELSRYQQAIKQLQLSTGHPSKWQEFTSLYSKHVSQSHGSAQFLPWHRFFLRLVEMELQKFSCDITIPYFDWTMNSGNLESSIVWQANYFGGDGDKEHGYCVRNHPFKNHHPQYWSPCLRRHFNNSVHMPDAINLQLILNKHTFDEFRILLEALSSLFHLFVGGHMVTPESPYDPIFLSHYAFIDKLWYIWETSKQNVIPRYPSVVRYIPMVPFGITPDDVLLSEKQLCVKYSPLTEAAPCNISESIMDNKINRDHSVLRIFDKFGIDKDGYNRNGYDKSGWDRKGFKKDGYNRDDFDIFGYDKNGYNRHGFDKHGCTANNFCFDATGESSIPDVYNEYGYNVLGFDRDGYDVFGFNRYGFDENDCSFYYNGPFYPLFKKWVDDQLTVMAESDLVNIARTCPQISSLPDWWLLNLWFKRGEQNVLLKAYEETMVIQHPVHEFPEYYTQHGWLPATPDEKFCFRLNYYLGCKLGSSIKDCPSDVCLSVTCPKYPDAKCIPYKCDTCEPRFYNEITGDEVDCLEHDCLSVGNSFHKEKDIWEEQPCTMCSCKKSVVACSKVRCLPNTNCNHPVTLQNQCCARCEGCYYEGKNYVNGVHFTHPTNHCVECFCQKGNVLCKDIKCKSLSWCSPEDIIVPKGYCCPICSRCDHSNNGSKWKEDQCHTCSCENSQVTCHSEVCPEANCTHSAPSSDHCCGLCKDCQYEGLFVKNGDKFKPDPCNECECKDGNVQCEQTVCTVPKCHQQLVIEGECCPVCFTGCQFEGSYYSHGDIFNPPSNHCLNCSCENNEVHCLPLACPPSPSCKNPVTPKGKCCPSECPKCEVNGKQYLNGEKWTELSTPCISCTCIEGMSICTSVLCDKICTHGLKEDKKCCLLCTDCLYEERLVPNGMSFMALDNPCDVCHCRDGNITCQSTRQQCPHLSCRNVEVPENACCPICKRCVDDVGRLLDHGRQWIHPSDNCQVCICHEGTIRCDRMICSARCSHPIQRPSHCCPDCNGCQYEGKIYYNGAPVKTNDTCIECSCHNGNVECESIHCPPITCSAPVSSNEECCPVCHECFLYNQTYSDGEIFTPSYDPCLNCTCKRGHADCKRTDHFCNPQCSHPIRVRGSCCPLCDGCEYERRNYRNGQKFTPPESDNCIICECLNGYVSCSRRKCPIVTCLHPFKVPNECCEQCPQTCTVNGIDYLEGDSWDDPEDECQKCQCLHSRIHCQRHTCPSVPCQHPAAPFGECCPYCQHCEFTRRLYRNEQEFFHVDDPCQKCICQNGTVTCQVIPCGPLQCQIPLSFPHHCCPICPPASECYIGTKTYQPQQTFLDPHNSCQECVCMDGGDVVCYQLPCPEVNCPNPISGPCCESCEGCSYANHSFPNNRKFTDPFDSCRNCYCNNGHVSCQQTHCQPTSCKSPITLEGECCARCLDCVYENNIYGNGEIFISPVDSCQECKCIYPKVSCHERVCPLAQCTHPVVSACCKECSDCLYEKRRYHSDQNFIDPLDQCKTCRCQAGNVTCEKTPCLPVNCTHPVDGFCCSECSDCYYNDRHYNNWQTFIHPIDHCQECKCHLGNVICQRKKCRTVECTHGIERNCCEECTDCFFNDAIILNGHSVVDTKNPCSECKCVNGSVGCNPKPCPAVYCEHPVMSECCLVCDKGCFYSGEFYTDGAMFTYSENPCEICSCNRGTVICTSKPCAEVSCSNPIQGECCLECPSTCIYGGIEVINGSHIPHLTDHCQECICKNEEVICKEKICSPVTCPHPASDGCCPVCEECEFEDDFRPQDITFKHPKDKCQTCVCKDGHVTCVHIECDPTFCINPIKLPGSCCPECQGCILLGNIYEHGSSFINPENNCEECICIESEIVCQKKPCMHNCTHPIPYVCCPECKSCLFEGAIYSSGESFHPDACRTCVCISGNVQCVTEDCPELTCTLRTKLLDQCCEVCRGCVFEGQEYEDGRNWVSPTNPCLSCQCQGGIVTCTELHCLAPCENPQPVPNECCPVCPDCELDGKTYQTGEVFTPTSKPCDICTCDSGKLQCITRECPELENCPREAIRDPSEGDCCPTCAGFSTNCTRSHFGMLVQPSNDPCIICECKEDYSWICVKEICPPIFCPEEYIVHKENECCPYCEACVSKVDEEMHKPDEVWTPFLEPCLLCKCENGKETCNKVECPPVVCKPNEILHKESDECCESCITVASLSCSYGNINYTDQQSWQPNVCTNCICEMGKVTCHTERCMPLNCPADYIPSVDPGHCCPKCIPRPATCLAFGDPHYRTFDGAIVHFQGTCRYILSTDCLSGNFTVEVQNSNRGIEGVSWTESVTIKLNGIIIDLWQGSAVSVNNQNITLPYFEDPQVYIEKTGNSVLVNTNVGVKVLWNGDSSAEVSVSGTYKQHTCGLCGNFNSYPQDDMKLRNGQIVLSAAVFGNSWKTTSNQLVTCKDVNDFDPCNNGGYHARKHANSKCAILKSPRFAPCHQAIPPEPYYMSCIYDLCACAENEDCLCDILSTYSQECVHAGVVLNWRSSTLCAISCPEDSGLMFDECGPVCTRTCENKDVPIEVLDAQCFKPCVPGCQCSADKVFHNNHCIDAKDCP